MEGSSRKMCDLEGDEIVISGMSGCFPNADDINQFDEKLFNKVDMVSTFDEFSYIKHPELPHHIGKINNMEKFDAQFFRVTPKQAATLDPVGRKLMEQAFLALFDAGVNPESLKGSKMGVFTGSIQSDCATLCLFFNLYQRSFVISGSCKAMLANRISYWMDGKGPSYGFDYGCSSSTAALEMAYNRIKNGEIDCAVVGGSNFSIHPIVNVNMRRAGLLCLDGKTKCFDKNGDGFVRSDAINVFFLQKAKDAKRIYAEVYHVKGKYFAAPDGSFSLIRDPKELEKFYEEFYSEIDVSPKDVEYLEANAFGIAKSDADELESIGNFFSKDKTTKIGCVKSNIGNTEAASGASAVIKLCLAYQRGLIPGNLHYNKPQDNIHAIKDGRLKVVTENMAFNRTFTAINNFCYTGSNFHALLKGHYKPKDKQRYKSTIPRLMLVSGRKEESVTKILDILENSPVDPEQYALLNNIFKHNIPGHTGRGFTLLDSNEEDKTISLSRSFDFYSGNVRPIWFMYSGMGSQWAGMGESLLRLPIFAAAINRCHKALLPKGLDIIKVITDKNIASLNILNSMVAITAIQIGLTDVLKSIGIFPDKIIGHSVGELASAYADESLTAEQTILASYSRATVSYETEFIKGKMAAVGLGHKEVGVLCPPEIQVACHNSSESATISGPADIVTKFVKSLTDQGIFAKEVASSNIAFHSRYIAKAGPAMLALQKQFITEPKLRSQKWVSTCYLPEDWDKPESKYASAEYFTHNLLSSVLFEEAATFIPDDAVIIEIAPHGLLQAILNRSHNKCLNLSLTKRGEKDSVKYLLEVVGKLYQAGSNPDVDVLYPKIEFPVSSETPGLSHLVGWEHGVDWELDRFAIEESLRSMYKEFIFSIHDDDHRFLKEYVRSGINVLPESTMLVLAWDTLASFLNVEYKNLSVVFRDVKFYNEVIIDPDETLKLQVAIQQASSKFEVTYGKNIIVDGFINGIKGTLKQCSNIIIGENEKHLNRNDIYTLMRNKGYSHEGHFQSLMSTNIERNKATIEWNHEWITFLDAIIQCNILSNNHNGVSIAKLLNQLTIDVEKHNILMSTAANGVKCYNAELFNSNAKTICGGVIMENLVLKDLPTTDILLPNLHTHIFAAHYSPQTVDLKTALLVNLQVVKENICGDLIKIKEITRDKISAISYKLQEWASIPALNIDIEIIEDNKNVNTENLLESDINILIISNLELSTDIINNLHENTYVLTIENCEKNKYISNMTSVTEMHTSNKTITLMKKTSNFNIGNINVVQMDETNFERNLKNHFEGDRRTILVLEKNHCTNVQNVINEVKKINNICLVIVDANSPKFAISNNYYSKQIHKNLKINTHCNGHWGSFCYIPLNVKDTKALNFGLIAKEITNIDSLAWTEVPVVSSKHIIQVCYSGLSSRDYIQLHYAEKINHFGMDFSGLDKNSTRVMGLLSQGALSSTVEADPDLLWPVPAHWSLAEAATVPLPYIHAFYCLAIHSALDKNNTVYINGAAGALGQAVIAVALSLGCTVFATVGNAEKKRFLLQLFPELDEKNIGYTYDQYHHAMVINRTNNKRCHIAINCSSGILRKSAMNCVGFSNCVLDVNDEDKKENENFAMNFLTEARSYKSVNMSNIFSGQCIKYKKILHAMLSEGIAKGFVRPLTSVIYAPTDITRAFKLLSYRKNRGRVIINMKNKSNNKFDVMPKLLLSSSKTYIVVCDGLELSVQLIDNLVQRGAKHIVAHIHPKHINGYFHVKYASWSALGANIIFNADDLQTESGCLNLIENAAKSGAIDGIFFTSKVNENNDDIIKQKNIDEALIIFNLDKVSRKCNDLRYFVVFAKLHLGTKDIVLEEIEKYCLMRQEQGLPSLFLRHVFDDTKLTSKSASAILNAMELSLKYNCTSVLSIDKQNSDTSKYTNKTKTNFDVGLQAFFSHVLEDEITAEECIIEMKTKSRNGYKHELLINPDETYVMMIPGLEGNYKALISISERLQKPAIALQLSPSLNESISEMAKKLLHYVQNRFHLKSPFYLLGYSFGVNVALEMASMLEAQGLVGVVYCLDSSPDAMRIHLNAYLGEMTEEHLQNSLIEHIFKLFVGFESTELKISLKDRTNWSDKVDFFIYHAKNHSTHAHLYLKNFVEAAYKRIKLAVEYRPKFQLESELVLLKGIPHPDAEKLSDDYNLYKYTTKPIQVFDIESDHALAHLDCRVSNFINRILL